MLNELVSAVQMHNWYPVAALAMLFLIQALKKPALANLFWARIPEGARWSVPLVAAVAMGFVDAFQRGDSLQQALASAGSALIAVGLTTVGAHASLKDSPVPWSGGKGGKPKS
jgi:hypothetical protein